MFGYTNIYNIVTIIYIQYVYFIYSYCYIPLKYYVDINCI